MQITKDTVQAQAQAAFNFHNQWGLLALATGVGKTKIAIDKVTEVCKADPDALIVLVVPTIKLRDNNWFAEFGKWKADPYWPNVKRVCYKSILTIENETIDLLILDEAHNLTPPHAQFFEQNNVKSCMGLSATPPDKDGNAGDKIKAELFKALKLSPPAFYYPLDQAVADGLVAPYEINVIECYLDNTVKYIPGGTKAKPFLQTEYGAYQYIDKLTKKMMYSKNPAAKFSILKRMHFVKNLKSKQYALTQLLDEVIPQDERYLIFFGTIDHANQVMGNRVFHSKSGDEALLAFQDERIERLGAVDALNEGINVENLDGAVIAQLDSQKRKMTQRIGRAVRLRPNHRAKIWILVMMGTVDEEWFKKAIADMDSSTFVYHHYKNISQIKYAS